MLNLNEDAVASRLEKPKSLHEVASDKYSPFVEKMQGLLVSGANTGQHIERRSIVNVVDMNVTCAAEELIPHNIRASQGIFFTGDQIAEKIALSLFDDIDAGASFFDPSCGAGNLLLAVAKRFPIKKCLKDTVEFWGGRFGGCDLNESFILATKLRLVALACQRHGVHEISKAELNTCLQFFSFFHVGDYLGTALGADFDCIVANPPFGHIAASQDVSWSTGKTQQAGVFVAQALHVGKPGQKIAAVLPDVLRCGTRYNKWRNLVEAESSITAVDVYGRFSKSVDVDVFLLSVIVGARFIDSHADIWQSVVGNDSPAFVKLKELFEVRVGPVVPHRLKDQGVRVPYLTTQEAPPFSTVAELPEINFSGTLYSPPFVVVRRTSSPSDKNRLVPSLVQGYGPLAVENHLLIISPRDRDIRSCLVLMDDLKDPRINEWLNAVSRCRHLTTKVLADIDIVRERYE
ncbi:N-6 DNA methylase [Pseudomonas sp. KCJK9111]|uniref:N-6 DNA methylase n=1 Tax=Pseudomonas sp. KCJK9111 TaxID=3344555 RepID=UPI003906C8F3